MLFLETFNLWFSLSKFFLIVTHRFLKQRSLNNVLWFVRVFFRLLPNNIFYFWLALSFWFFCLLCHCSWLGHIFNIIFRFCSIPSPNWLWKLFKIRLFVFFHFLGFSFLTIFIKLLYSFDKFLSELNVLIIKLLILILLWEIL